MKKFLVATITSILLLIGIVAGSIYYEKYKIEHIVKSDKAKTAIENMLKKIENKALTPDGISPELWKLTDRGQKESE